MLLALILLPLIANAGIPYRAFYETNQHNDLIYGDIVMTPRDKFIQQLPDTVRSKLFIKDNGYNRWPNNVVPYNIESTYNNAQKQTIKKALEEIEQKTCFKFVVWKDQKDYVNIKEAEGCNSPLGRQGGNQRLSLGKGCVDVATVQHEVMHALGIHHEHQRPDRDEHIEIIYGNVEPQWRIWFDTVTTNQYELKGFKYDIHSIMHYHSTAFGKTDPSTRYPMITMKVKSSGQPVPYNNKLTDEDVKKIQAIGNCPAKSGSNNNNNNDKKQDKKPNKKPTKKRRNNGRK